MPDPQGDVRIDKWLWAARFYSTRSLARQAVESGRVVVAGQRVKPARPVRVGDEIAVRIGDDERVVRVLAISDRRGSAPVARTLYEESAESIERRERLREQPRWGAEPAQTIEGGRPTKRDRRRLRDWEGR